MPVPVILSEPEASRRIRAFAMENGSFDSAALRSG